MGPNENKLNNCHLFGVRFLLDRSGSNTICGPWYRIQALWDHIQVRTDIEGNQSVSTVIGKGKAAVLKSKQPKGLYPKCQGCKVNLQDHGTFSEVMFIGDSEKTCNKAKMHFKKKVEKIGDDGDSPDEDVQVGCMSSSGKKKKRGKSKKKAKRESSSSYEPLPEDGATGTIRGEGKGETPHGAGARRRRNLDENLYSEWQDEARVSPTRHVLAPKPTTFQSMINTNALVHILQHDITRLRVDVVVNAANPQLQHGAGVAHAIAQAAGRELERACSDWVRKNGPVPVTQHACTVGGRLPCREVMHAVGPVYSSRAHNQCEDELYKTFSHCLQVAAGQRYSSIALPAISSGKSGNMYCAKEKDGVWLKSHCLLFH